MKIHYLVSSLDSGGAEFIIPDLVRFFRQQGHEVQLTACEPKDMGTAPRLAEAGLACHMLADPRAGYLPTLARLLRRLRADRPDILWTSLTRATSLGQIAGKLLGIPVVSWKHSAVMRRSMQMMSPLSRLWIADSAGVEAYLKQNTGLPAHNVVQWPIFRCNMNAQVPRYWASTAQETLHLGSVGRLHKVKNYHLVLGALAKFREKRPELARRLHFSIAGDGPERQQLTEQIARLDLGECITLAGALRDVTPFLEGLHVYTQPSQYEGLCLAAHEAMAAGLAVIAPPIGELADTVREGETGFLLPSPDKGEEAMQAAFCQQLERIFAEPALLARYGRAAQTLTRQKFGPEAFETHGKEVLARVTALVASPS